MIVPPPSRQNYPLHGSEMNGFHSGPTTYNHTSTINGEGIMGKIPKILKPSQTSYVYLMGYLTIILLLALSLQLTEAQLLEVQEMKLERLSHL